MKTKNPWLPGVIVLGLAACLGSFAQSVSGDLTGTIYDASGAIVPNATIIGKNSATGVEASTKSTAIGEYHLFNLQPGTYTITVTAAGFKTAQIGGIAVTLDAAATANVKLEVGDKMEVVEIPAAEVVIDTTTAAVQTAFQSSSMADLPIASDGSGVINLSLLNAGVGSSGAIGEGVGPSVGGQRPRKQQLHHRRHGQQQRQRHRPVGDSAQRCGRRILARSRTSSPPSSAIPRAASSTRLSRAERTHSTARRMSTCKTATSTPPTTFRSWTAVPCIRATTITASAAPWAAPSGRTRSSSTASTSTVRLAKVLRPASFMRPPRPAGTPFRLTTGINQTNLSQLKKYLGTATSAVSAASIGGYPLVGPGNESLGKSRSPPPPSRSKSACSASPPRLTPTTRSGIGAVDFNISDRDSLHGRFILNRAGFIDTAASLPVFFTTVPFNSYLVAITEYHTFSPTLINEFRLGYNRYSLTLSGRQPDMARSGSVPQHRHLRAERPAWPRLQRAEFRLFRTSTN